MSGSIYVPPSRLPIGTTNNSNIISSSTIDISLNGLLYAFPASGGYSLTQLVRAVTMLPYQQLKAYNMTNTIQVLFDVRSFNNKLGIIKDSSNILILNNNPNYNAASLGFDINSIVLTAAEFVSGLNTNSIISVGAYSTIYRDFVNYISSYFSYSAGFSSLFTITSQIDINGGVFNKTTLYNLFKGTTTDLSGRTINDLSGSITINDVNELLRYVVYTNPFGNRDPSGNANTASDINNPNKYTVGDGFYANDLIYIPNGVSITLSMNINNNNVVQDSSGIIYVENTTSGTNGVDTLYSNGDFKQITMISNTNITRVVTVPLLIRLINVFQSSVIVVNSTINFNVTVSLILNTVFTDPSGGYFIDTTTIQSILEATAQVMGIDVRYLTYTYTIVPITNNRDLSSLSRATTNSFSSTLRSHEKMNLDPELSLNTLINIKSLDGNSIVETLSRTNTQYNIVMVIAVKIPITTETSMPEIETQIITVQNLIEASQANGSYLTTLQTVAQQIYNQTGQATLITSNTLIEELALSNFNIVNPIGPTGSFGTSGPTGPSGPTGSTGSTGPIGLSGSRGMVGSVGLSGYRGSKPISYFYKG